MEKNNWIIFPYWKHTTEELKTSAEQVLEQCYQDGLGVEKDLEKAEEWHSKSMRKRDRKENIKLERENTQNSAKVKRNEKRIVSPFQDNAFSEPVIRQAVVEQIDFQLPDFIWNHINEAFEFYWDEEVGIGGYVGYESMFFSIKRQLVAAHIIYPSDQLFRIVEAICTFIDRIPGVVIHD